MERAIQRYLLPGIAMSYLLAALWPAGGLWLRSFDFLGGQEIGLGSATPVNLLLALLLFNTGLTVPWQELAKLARHPRLLMLGMSIRITSCALIMLLVLAAGILFEGPIWDDVLLGLILVTVMPVANSSAGWSHHSEANVGLSMWLILLSVLLSPWLVPGLLTLSSQFTHPHVIPGYEALAAGYAGSFVMLWVIIPACLGIVTRSWLLAGRFGQMKVGIKLITFLCLILLNYSNGSVSLPEVLGGGDPWQIVMTLCAATVLCMLLFAAPGGGGAQCDLSMKDRLSVMYSSAMSNTGVALVLLTSLLPGEVVTHLVVIFYTLLQHIVAGGVDQLDYCWRRLPTVKLRESEANSSTMISQPVSKTSSGRPTTHTGSQAAITEPVASISNGS